MAVRLRRSGWGSPQPLGEAIRRPAAAASAYEDRAAGFAVNINAISDHAGDDAAGLAWARTYWQDLRSHSAGRVYVNFLGTEGEERVRAAYGGEKYAQLVALKDRYDPTNVFRLNQNIAPSMHV